MVTSPLTVQPHEWLSYCSNESRSYYRRHFVCSPCYLSYLQQLFTIFTLNRTAVECAHAGVRARACARDIETERWEFAGGVACSELMPQIVVRCRSLPAMRFGQEENVIGFVQSSWQPTPADICSLLTTQTYLHQGTHTHKHTQATLHKTASCTHWFMHSCKQPFLRLLRGKKACPCKIFFFFCVFFFANIRSFSC